MDGRPGVITVLQYFQNIECLKNVKLLQGCSVLYCICQYQWFMQRSSRRRKNSIVRGLTVSFKKKNIKLT